MAKTSVTKKQSKISFADLKKGDVFKVDETGYMKIFIDERRSQNVVNLNNGSLERFEDATEVDTDVQILVEN